MKKENEPVGVEIQKSLVVKENIGVLPVKELKGQIQAIQEVLDRVMKKGCHYDTIPGCGKKLPVYAGHPGRDPRCSRSACPNCRQHPAGFHRERFGRQTRH